MIHKKSKIFLGMLFVFVALSFVLAGNVDTISFKDKATGNSLTGVDFLLYTCSDSICSSIISQVQNLNSGSNNFVSYEYASTENLNYGAYMFKACYLPHEDGYTNFGDGGTFAWTYELEKATSCHSPIDSFSITNSNFVNEPVVIDIQANLEADAHSAFTNLLLEFIPPGFEDYYSAKTTITLEVLNSEGDVVHTESKTYEILADTVQNVQFTWTPDDDGDYTANIKTNVIDCQCQSSFEQFSEKQFTVLPERPQNQCYTIVNDLEATPEFPTEDEVVTIKFNKISNFADDDFSKTTIPTNITLQITDSNDNLVHSQSQIISANSNGVTPQNVSISWTPDVGGSFNIKVTGKGQSSLCTGKDNFADTAILGFFVKSANMFQVKFVVSDSETSQKLSGAKVKFGSQTGTTNSIGEVLFNSNPGTFNWEVSKNGYDKKTGSSTISGDKTISVSLNPSDDDTGKKGKSKGSKGSLTFFEPSSPQDKGVSGGIETLKPKEGGFDFGKFLIWILLGELVLIIIITLVLFVRGFR